VAHAPVSPRLSRSQSDVHLRPDAYVSNVFCMVAPHPGYLLVVPLAVAPVLGRRSGFRYPCPRAVLILSYLQCRLRGRASHLLAINALWLTHLRERMFSLIVFVILLLSLAIPGGRPPAEAGWPRPPSASPSSPQRPPFLADLLLEGQRSGPASVNPQLVPV
jgi:hypothetical protein